MLSSGQVLVSCFRHTSLASPERAQSHKSGLIRLSRLVFRPVKPNLSSRQMV